MKTEKDKLKHATFNDPLVGAYFLTFGKDENENKRVVEGQGYIVGKVQDGVYMVQYLAGRRELIRLLVKLEDMHDWAFYRTYGQMNRIYKDFLSPRRRPRREAAPTNELAGTEE